MLSRPHTKLSGVAAFLVVVGGVLVALKGTHAPRQTGQRSMNGRLAAVGTQTSPRRYL